CAAQRGASRPIRLFGAGLGPAKIFTAISLQFHAIPTTPFRLLPTAAATPAQGVPWISFVSVSSDGALNTFGFGLYGSLSSTKSRPWRSRAVRDGLVQMFALR